jgi:hypothetical protein
VFILLIKTLGKEKICFPFSKKPITITESSENTINRNTNYHPETTVEESFQLLASLTPRVITLGESQPASHLQKEGEL